MKAIGWVVIAVIMGLIGVSLGSGSIRKPSKIKPPILIDSVKVDSFTVKIYMSYGKEN